MLLLGGGGGGAIFARLPSARLGSGWRQKIWKHTQHAFVRAISLSCAFVCAPAASSKANTHCTIVRRWLLLATATGGAFIEKSLRFVHSLSCSELLRLSSALGSALSARRSALGSPPPPSASRAPQSPSPERAALGFTHSDRLSPARLQPGCSSAGCRLAGERKRRRASQPAESRKPRGRNSPTRVRASGSAFACCVVTFACSSRPVCRSVGRPKLCRRWLAGGRQVGVAWSAGWLEIMEPRVVGFIWPLRTQRALRRRQRRRPRLVGSQASF